MAEQPIQGELANRGRVPSVVLRAWRGLFSNANPHVIGAEYLTEQENLTNVVTGQIQARNGMRAVKFDQDV